MHWTGIFQLEKWGSGLLGSQALHGLIFPPPHGPLFPSSFPQIPSSLHPDLMLALSLLYVPRPSKEDIHPGPSHCYSNFLPYFVLMCLYIKEGRNGAEGVRSLFCQKSKLRAQNVVRGTGCTDSSCPPAQKLKINLTCFKSVLKNREGRRKGKTGTVKRHLLRAAFLLSFLILTSPQWARFPLQNMCSPF